jgi:hypothetical protein
MPKPVEHPVSMPVQESQMSKADQDNKETSFARDEISMTYSHEDNDNHLLR